MNLNPKIFIPKVGAYLLAALLAALLVAGCGGGSSEAPDPTTLPPATATDAIDCLGCHGAVKEKWLAGHGNLDQLPASAQLGEECLICHDRSGLGGDPLPSFGAPRPLVHCRDCHGHGEFHAGNSIMPGVAVCGSCHDGSVPLDHASLQNNRFQGIYERYSASGHARGTTYTDPACAVCHTDLGFRLDGWAMNYDPAGLRRFLGRADWLAEFAGRSELTEPGVIGCQTCHDPHDGELRAQASHIADDPAAGVLFSRTFNLCTGCHQVFLRREGTNYRLDPAVYQPTAGESAADLLARLEIHADDRRRVIADTHFSGNFPVIEGEKITILNVAGYGINPASERACLQCHNPHRPG